MAPPAPRHRDRAHRPRVQPPRRRAARRLRPAAALILLAACGKAATPPEDYLARFLESRWDDLATADGPALARALKAYVDGPHPIYPEEDPRFQALLRALVRLRPPPESLAPLLGPRGPADEVDARLIKRDALAITVLDSLVVRWFEGGEAPAPLLDVALACGPHFAFDPVYAESHTRTGEELADFLSQAPVTPELVAAVERHLDPLLDAWRGRVTDKSSSTMFGIVLRILGVGGGARLLREWGGMREEERVDLLERFAWMELDRPLLRHAAAALLDPSPRVRRSAHKALLKQGAPVEGVDPSAREAELVRVRGEVERWIETRP